MKLIALKLAYFKSNWNRFDFALVWIGVFGLVMSIATYGEAPNKSGKIIRVARVLRTLRFLRIFRLMHARMSADKFVSQELARHMKKVTILDCFVRAHVRAQLDLIKYFGGNGKLDEVNECEIARCILQSQVSTYRALRDAAHTQEQLGIDTFKDLQNLHKRKAITEGLSQWVLTAHADGALSATEAHAIVHPLNHLIAHTVKTLADRSEGVIKEEHGHGHGGGGGHGGAKPAEVQETPITIKTPEIQTPTGSAAGP